MLRPYAMGICIEIINRSDEQCRPRFLQITGRRISRSSGGLLKRRVLGLVLVGRLRCCRSGKLIGRCCSLLCGRCRGLFPECDRFRDWFGCCRSGDWSRVWCLRLRGWCHAGASRSGPWNKSLYVSGHSAILRASVVMAPLSIFGLAFDTSTNVYIPGHSAGRCVSW